VPQGDKPWAVHPFIPKAELQACSERGKVGKGTHLGKDSTHRAGHCQRRVGKDKGEASALGVGEEPDRIQALFAGLGLRRQAQIEGSSLGGNESIHYSMVGLPSSMLVQ
jgi:hypothetical protein